MAIMIKTPQEIEKMRRSGKAVRTVLELVRTLVKPGVTTLDLEKAAEAKIAELGATPAFKGYRGYPCVLCTSVNDQVVVRATRSGQTETVTNIGNPLQSAPPRPGH